jgi:hypothetical protein
MGKGVRKWLGERIIGGIHRFAQDLPGERRGNALEKISTALDNVDDIGWIGPCIWKPMLRRNMIIYIEAADKISELSREPWIGKRYAFQIPAYYYALRAMAGKRRWEISPEDVIREAMD